MSNKERTAAVVEPVDSINPAAERKPAPAAAPPTVTTPTLKRRLKNLGKSGLRRAFEMGQRLGFDLLPRHFYSEIPDVRELRADDSWKAPRSMIGVRGADVEEQFEFLESCRAAVGFTDRRGDLFARACADNGEPGFNRVDAEVLDCFVRAVRPGKIVQVGCGVSTAIVLNTAAKTPGYNPEVVCIEPYPTEFLKKSSRAGRIRLVAEKAQTVALEELTGLGGNGFLFIDSTHTVKPGSEVNRLILEVLPRLESGAWVHFHDVYFPYDYQRGLLDDELFFCNETALLHAFLIDNAKYTVRMSQSMLHHADPARLARSLQNYLPARTDHGLRASAGDLPASIYLQSF